MKKRDRLNNYYLRKCKQATSSLPSLPATYAHRLHPKSHLTVCIIHSFSGYIFYELWQPARKVASLYCPVATTHSISHCHQFKIYNTVTLMYSFDIYFSVLHTCITKAYCPWRIKNYQPNCKPNMQVLSVFLENTKGERNGWIFFSSTSDVLMVQFCSRADFNNPTMLSNKRPN